MNVVVQLFGVGAMISLFFIYQQKSRKNMILCKLSADIFWIFHYSFLGATAGMIPNLVGFFREIVFFHRNTKKWANTPLWVAIFIIINLLLGVRTFSEWYNVIPIIASSFVTLSLWLNNPKLIKIISAPVSASFLVYDMFVGSYIGVINESISILSIIIYFIRNKKRRKSIMKKHIFSDDVCSKKELIITPGAPISDTARTIALEVSASAIEKGNEFAKEISERFVSDFEKPGDKMAHVSTFLVLDGFVYVSYYANTKDPEEDPKNQTARFAYAPVDDIDNKTFFDLQTTGDVVDGKVIDMVYDTILMKKDENTLYVMWTARTEGNFYRFYCPFYIPEKRLGKIGVNRFKAGNITNDFSISGVKNVLAENDIPVKKIYSDIGIMQKTSTRIENGKIYFYTGMYIGDFNCIIKSSDLVTWEYVSKPDFINDSQWENATYVLGDKVYYFVRQQKENKCGFLTAFDLVNKTWDSPVEIHDCQSRSDFIYYKNNLYLFHAPIDRDYIGIVKIDTDNIAESEVVLQAKMHTSCFYPFVQYYKNNELAMSYTVSRQHIRLAQFTLSKYL